MATEHTTMMGIYVLTNKINGKKYVGQSLNIENRLAAHKRGRKRLIDKVIRKYGWDNFEVQTTLCLEEELDSLETEQIKQLDCLAPKGYNLDTGGNEHRHFSEATIQKMSLAQLGENNAMFGVKGEAHPRFGKTHSEATRKKMSKNHADISGSKNPMYGKSAILGKTGSSAPFFGHKHSEETKAKIRNSRRVA